MFAHAKSSFTSPSQKPPNCASQVVVHLFLQQCYDKWIECIDVLGKSIHWEVGITFNDINHHRPPRNNIALLCFIVEINKGADNIGTQSV